MSPIFKCYNTQFDWPTNNCGLMAANYYLETYGIDFAQEYRNISSPYIFYRTIVKNGGFEKILESKGFKQVGLNCKDGDVAVIPHGRHNLALGIVNGSQIVSAGGFCRDITEAKSIYRHRTISK